MTDWKQIGKKMQWENKKLKRTIKYWTGNETGGYNVLNNGKRLNKEWLPSFPKAVRFAKLKSAIRRRK